MLPRKARAGVAEVALLMERSSCSAAPSRVRR